MEQLRCQNIQEGSLNRIFAAENTLLDSEKRKQKKKKIEDNFIKNAESSCRFKYYLAYFSAQFEKKAAP